MIVFVPQISNAEVAVRREPSLCSGDILVFSSEVRLLGPLAAMGLRHASLASLSTSYFSSSGLGNSTQSFRIRRVSRSCEIKWDLFWVCKVFYWVLFEF